MALLTCLHMLLSIKGTRNNKLENAYQVVGRLLWLIFSGRKDHWLLFHWRLNKLDHSSQIRINCSTPKLVITALPCKWSLWVPGTEMPTCTGFQTCLTTRMSIYNDCHCDYVPDHHKWKHISHMTNNVTLRTMLLGQLGDKPPESGAGV